MLVRRALLGLGSLALVLLLAPQPPAQPVTYPIGTYTAQSTVTALVNAAKSAQDASQGSYSNLSPGTYQPLTEMETWAVATGLMQALVGDYQAAADTLGPVGFRAYWFTSTDKRRYFLLKEPTVTRGLGLILIYPEARRNLVISAPHVTYDTDSHTSARIFFLSDLKPVMLILGGTFRCNTLVPSGCTDSLNTGTCSGGIPNARAVSDLNHAVNNTHQAGAYAARNLSLRWFGVHSNASELVDLLIGDGGPNRAPAEPRSLIRRFRAVLPLYVSGFTYASCNDPVDDEVAMLYCAGVSDDTQARLLHGDPARPFSSTGPSCTADAPNGDAYIAFEMRSAARSALNDIIDAMLAVYPPDRPGTGQ